MLTMNLITFSGSLLTVVIPLHVSLHGGCEILIKQNKNFNQEKKMEGHGF